MRAPPRFILRDLNGGKWPNYDVFKLINDIKKVFKNWQMLPTTLAKLRNYAECSIKQSMVCDLNDG